MFFSKKCVTALTVIFILSLFQGRTASSAQTHSQEETIFNQRGEPIFRVHFDTNGWKTSEIEAVREGFDYVANVLKKGTNGVTPIVKVQKSDLKDSQRIAQYTTYFNSIFALQGGKTAAPLHGLMEFNEGSFLNSACTSSHCFNETTKHELGHGLFLNTDKPHAKVKQTLETYRSDANILDVEFGGGHIHNLPYSIMDPSAMNTFPGFMEVELALLEDQHTNLSAIDRRDLFGYSLYQSDQILQNDHVYFARNSKDSAYIPYLANNNPFGIGFHLYGSRNAITQTGSILTKGEKAVGIRIDGNKNTLTIAPNTLVHAYGSYGVGILAAHGKDHQLIVHGSLSGGKQAVYISPKSHISSIHLMPKGSIDGDIVQEEKSGFRKFFPQLTSLIFEGRTPGEETVGKFIYKDSIRGSNIKTHIIGSYTALYGGAHSLYNLTVHPDSLLAGNSTFTLEKKSFLLRPIYRESGVFKNAGILSPSSSENAVDPQSSFGRMQINGDFEQTPTGRLVIDISSNNDSDFLHVTKKAYLNGTLEIRPQFGFYRSNQQFYFLWADKGIYGDFQHFLSPQSPTLNWKGVRTKTSYGISVLSSNHQTPLTPSGDTHPPKPGEESGLNEKEGDYKPNAPDSAPPFSDFPNNEEAWNNGWKVVSEEIRVKKQSYEDALHQSQTKISHLNTAFYEEENTLNNQFEIIRIKTRDPHESVREQAYKDAKELLEKWTQAKEKITALRAHILDDTRVSLESYKAALEKLTHYQERWEAFRNSQHTHGSNSSLSQAKKERQNKELSSLEAETKDLLNSVSDQEDDSSLHQLETLIKESSEAKAESSHAEVAAPEEPFRQANAYSQYGRTLAERSIGEALDHLVSVAKTPLSELYAALDFSNPDGSQIREALSDLSPMAYGGAFSASLSRELLISDTLRARSPSPLAPLGQWQVFALPFTAHLEQKSRDFQVGYTLRTSGIVMGIEQENSSIRGLTWGIHGAITQKDPLSVKTGDKAHGDLQAWGLGVQMRYNPHKYVGADLSAHVRFGLEQGSLSRTIAIDSLIPYRTEQKGEWLGWTRSASVSGAYMWPVTASLSVGPVGGIDYVSITHPQVFDHGSQGLNMVLGSTRAHALQTSVGLRGVFFITDALTMNVQTLWNRDIFNQMVKQEAHFSGYEEAFFSVHSRSKTPQNLQVSSQMTYDITPRVRVGTQLALQLAHKTKPQTAVSLNASVRF